jgi:hypothetical protein
MTQHPPPVRLRPMGRENRRGLGLLSAIEDAGMFFNKEGLDARGPYAA